MTRTDVHKPSSIIPTDYELVVIRSRDEFGQFTDGGHVIFNQHRSVTGGVFAPLQNSGGCHVCGAKMIDYAIFYHAPSNSYIKTGQDCASKIELGLEDEFRRVASLRRAEASRKAQVERACEKLEELGIQQVVEQVFAADIGGVREENLDVIVGTEFASTLTDFEYNQLLNTAHTLVDMVRNLIKWGWSEKQERFAKVLAERLLNAKETIYARREANSTIPDAPEGKVEVVGKVLMTKEQEGYYGYEHKMLVESTEGWKVWVSIPSAISRNVEKNVIVRFNATLTRSTKDSKFAFGKRPSKAQIITC